MSDKAAYTYHSPDGDRVLFAESFEGEGEKKTVNLVNAEGDLEIGKCKIEARVGACSPVVKVAPVAEAEAKPDSAPEPDSKKK